MMTFLFFGLFGTGVFFAGLPIVCFALMLETRERRKVELASKSPHASSIRLLTGVHAVPSGAAAHELTIPRPASAGIPTVHGLQLS